MVQKVVAGVGALFTAIGLIMLIVISVTEDFVIVVIPNSTCTDDNPLGTLGVFTATFDPECVGVTDNEALDRYPTLSPAETPTTSFWPLFPAQNAFGGAIPNLPDFTTCEDFYTSDATLLATSLAFGDGLLATLEEGIQGGQAEVTTTFTTIFAGLPVGINTFSQQALNTAIGSALTTLKGNILAGTEGLDGLRFVLEVVNGCTPTDPLLAFPSYTGCSSMVFNDGLTASVAGNLFTAFTNELSGPRGLSDGVYTALGGGNVTLGGERVDDLAELYAGHVGAGLFAPSVARAGLEDILFGGANTTVIGSPTTDFGSVRSAALALQTAAGGPGANPTLDQLAFAMTYCSGNNTVATCIANGFTDVPVPTFLNDTTPVKLCIASLAGGLLQTPLLTAGVTPATCTYSAILLALAGANVTELRDALEAVPTFAPFLPLISAQFTAALGDTVGLCRAFGRGMFNCVDFALNGNAFGTDFITAEQEAGPMDYDWSTGTLTACTGLGLLGTPCVPAGTVRGVANATQLAPGTTVSVATAINVLFNVMCPAVLANNRSACLNRINTQFEAIRVTPLGGGLTVEDVLTGAQGTVFAAANVNGTLEERIAACKDDETDKGIFEAAQAMIPAAMALAGIATIAAIAAAALNKTPIVAVAALLSLAAGGITIGALLYIRTAPVYELVGGDPVDNVPLYKASGGQLLGLLGGVLPLIGGVAMIVSAFLNRPGSSSEMTSKVDNTY